MLPKNRNHQTFILFLIIFFSVLFINSCKKTESLMDDAKSSTNEIVPGKTPENFLKLPANAAPVLQRVANELEKQNKTKEFITAFIKKEGFPVWNKASIVYHKRKAKAGVAASLDGGGSDTVVYIPLVVNAQQYVHGFLKATVADTVQIEIFRQNDYKNFPFQTPSSSANITTAEKFALGMMIMDKDVFGNKEFKIEDKRLFHINTDYSDTAGMLLFIKIDSLNGENLFGGGTTVNNLFPPCITAIKFINTCNNGFSGNTSNIETPTPGGCYRATYVTLCPVWGGDEENGGWPVPPGGGGGGGGNPPGGGGPPCGSFGATLVNGFVPVECEPGPGGNPWPSVEMLDLQWIAANVKDSTNDPCITNALNTLKEISPKFPTLIRNFFDDVVSDIKMTFKKYTNAAWFDSGGIVNPPEGAFTVNNTTSNVFNVLINKYYNNCTDLGLAATVLHEALHCQLLNWYRLAYSSPDSIATRIYLASNYGYLFPPPPINGHEDSVLRNIIDGQNPTQHNDMILRYKNDVGSALYQFALKKNINVDLGYCMELAWTGCFDSKAYKDMRIQYPSDAARIKNRCLAEKDPFSNLGYTDSNGDQYLVNPSTFAKGHPCH